MPIEAVRSVGVLGAGAMGHQIAEVVARVGGYPVTIWDLSQDLVDKGFESIRANHRQHFLDKGKMTEREEGALVARMAGTTDLATVAKADFVIEVIVEDKEIKRRVFKQLDELAPAHTVFASNTSYLSVTDLAAATNRPDKFVGMHFFQPVSVMKLVEVTPGTLASEDAVQTVHDLAVKIGKEPLLCRDASFGFVANRLMRALRLEAVKLVADRIASPRDVDRAMKLGYNMPWGPLELADMTGGWGITMLVADEALRELGPIDGPVPPLVRTMVRAGYTGGRGKKGIYAFWDEIMSKW